MKPESPYRIIFDTATGCAVLIAVLLALLLGYAVAHAQAIQVKTGNYQLDMGDTVYWWLDEERGLLCEMIPHTGLACLPLTASVYAWPALPE